LEMKNFEKYHLLVEGECERIYFEHLQKIIRESNAFKKNVSFNIHVTKRNPSKKIKTLSIFYKYSLPIIFIYDIENNNNLDEFERLIDNTLDLCLKREISKNDVIKNFKYSNLSFEVWILLHKQENVSCVNCVGNYLNDINNCYNKSFESIDDFKNQKKFKDIISQITLDDVKNACDRARNIRTYVISKYNRKEYKGIKYYETNPDLNIHEFIERMFNDIK